jgi:integrase/recombinase XerD
MGKCRPLADSEIELMKIHTPDVRDKCILIMLERTGYRSNEIASLRTDDVFDFSSQTLKPRIQVKREFMKKKQGRRSIPLHPELRTALTVWLAKLQQSGFLRAGIPLWLSRKHVTRLLGLARETIWRIVRAAALRAGVNPERVGCHSYRKSLAVKCWNLSGKNIMAVKEALGHKEVSSTQAYLDRIMSDDAIDALFMAA